MARARSLDQLHAEVLGHDGRVGRGQHGHDRPIERQAFVARHPERVDRAVRRLEGADGAGAAGRTGLPTLVEPADRARPGLPAYGAVSVAERSAGGAHRQGLGGTTVVGQVGGQAGVQAELVLIAKVLAGGWFDATGGFIPVEPEELRKLWLQARPLCGGKLDARPAKP